MRKWLLLLIVALVSCIASTPVFATGQKPITIGSTNFAEQLILANIYADVLEAHDISVKRRFNLGSREIVFPALKSGELDVLPEYSGALLGYLTGGKSKAHEKNDVLESLKAHLPKGVVALKASPAEDKDALVVTAETADKYKLKNVSDLKSVAGELILGGPPELQTRFDGIPGLKEVYGIKFKTFRALDAGGPLTLAALDGGQIDVARMFSTQGVIADRGWVLLEDDKNLVPAQNLLPVGRKKALTPEVRKLLDAVSEKLKTVDLQRMNQRVSIDHEDPAAVARDWVEKQSLGD